MSQSNFDKIVVSTELSIKEKVKILVPILMEMHNITYANAYQKAKRLVDVEFVKKSNLYSKLSRRKKSLEDPIYRAAETKRKNAIIKNKYETDPDYKAKKNAATTGNNYLNKLRRELF
jgi:hypothetical protein